MIGRIKVIVPSFNSIDYIERCLHSVEMQTYKNYDVCVVDDASTLPKQKEIITEFCEKNQWKFLVHRENEGALASLVHAIPLLNCQDQDVIVVLDGDDWFAHPHVFEKLFEVYSKKDIYLTWGQCEIYPSGQTPMKYAQPVPDMVIQEKLYRDIPFVFWHLGTFKYYLWRHIDDRDLRDIDGRYFRIMKDKATLFPMLEMAGEKIQFISETLYIYNLENPLNDYANTLPEEHKRVDELIRSRKRYATLPFFNE